MQANGSIPFEDVLFECTCNRIYQKIGFCTTVDLGFTVYSSSVHLLDESWWICWGNEFHIHQGKQTPILSGLAMSFHKDTAPKTGNKVPVNVYSAACMRQILPFAKSPRIKVSASKKSKRSKLVMFQTWTAGTTNQTQTDCLGQILPHPGREGQMRKHRIRILKNQSIHKDT